jgi:hypothetical protein
MKTCLACKCKWLGAAAGCALLVQPQMLWLLLLLMLLAAGDVSGGHPAGRDRPHGVCHEGEAACSISCFAPLQGGGGILLTGHTLHLEMLM